MPELPEVEAIVRHLEPLIVGSRIVSVDILLPRIVRQGKLEDSIGSKFQSISRRGKYIRIDLDNDTVLTIHLKMSGVLLWDPRPDDLDKFIRVVIQTDWGRLVFRDIRTLGGIWQHESHEDPTGQTGIEPFDPAFNADLLQKLLANSRKVTKPFLLDQQKIAGIGNIYASEILFSAKINPQRLANSLIRREIETLFQSIQIVLRSAIESKGTTFRDFRLSDGRDGEFQNFLNVYGREDKPCRVCDSKIVRLVQSTRSTFYCPKCQPER